MIRNNRSKDQIFDPDESLYRRVPPECFPKTKGKKIRLTIYSLELPDVSVVRSKHDGEPEYALYDDVNKVHYKNWGITSVKAVNIPNSIPFHGNNYSTNLNHAPHKNNYHHSEIQVYDHTDQHLTRLKDFPIEFIAIWRQKMRSLLAIERLPTK